MNPIEAWFRRHFSDPQVIILAVVLLSGLAVIMLAGQILAPAIASVILAYLLEEMIAPLVRAGVPRFVAVVVIFLLFLAVLLGIVLVLIPLLVGQVGQLAQQLPVMVSALREQLLRLPEMYPDLIDQQQAVEMVEQLRFELLMLGQRLLAYSVALLPTLVSLSIYVVLVPLLVFFFLKDKARILSWFVGFLPEQRSLVNQVWRQVDLKVGGYVRGKLYEIVIVGVVSYIVFLALGLQFSVLLATATGLSVLVPYVGALVVALPVALVAYFQFGTINDLLWVLGAYGIIQAIDGNVLAPLLLAETVNLHPNAIIVAILVFGGIWGFWGVFFAVPLASVVQAVVESWPRQIRGRQDRAAIPEQQTAP
jgi:putative permease